ncbi:MAG: hypothetical protein ABIL40_09635 [candidate division WOR-3 bacterium]
MRYFKAILALVSAGVLIIGCGRKDDEAEITELLDRSWFIGGEVQTSDDSTATPQLINKNPQITGDTFPFYVKWVRFIERPVERHYDIEVVGDSAFVIMTAYLKGTPPNYGFFVKNDTTHPTLVHKRTITDSIVRRIKCFRDDTGWHIASITVADIYTAGAQHPVTINKVEVRVGGNLVFSVDDPNTYFTKAQLPTFKPYDTVEVTVYCQAEGDSTWAFLHHGAGHRPGVGLRRHWRQPFYRENTTTFTRTWYIADDSIINTPAVRHSAIDVIGWATLFGDSTATYYSHAWGIPYIIKNPEDTLPGDSETD